MISPYEILTMHATYTYIYVMHLIFCGRIFKHTVFHKLYNQKKEHKITMHSHLLGIVSQLDEFHIIPSQIFITYNSQSIVLGIHCTSSEGTHNNMIFLPQEGDTFDRTEKGRTWLTSQDYQDYTQLTWKSTIKIHIIDSQTSEYLKNKALLSAGTYILLVSNPL